ncbi:MAG: GntR family transcriptional regulator [Marinobacter sp.]|jgi:DNA-binding GntR family transcriptional regulator|nr:GntR family transcriptional regulator [Marinobacter sp.]
MNISNMSPKVSSKVATPKLHKILARPDYVDEVYNILLNAISDGTLAPGVRITQEEIAEQMQVSRSPVLQALRLLKKDGLVQDAPGRGVLVAPLTVDFISNLYLIRGALDKLAAKMAAERCYQMDPELIEQGRRISQGDDVKAMTDADLAFHHEIYKASGNPLIAESAHVYWVHLRRAMGAVLQHSAQRQSIWDEHEAIAKAISEGDPVKAGELSDLHTNKARECLTLRLDEYLR